MGRPRKKPNFDQEKQLNSILDAVMEAYIQMDERDHLHGKMAYGSITELADELGFQPNKLKKLLITATLRDGQEIFLNDTCSEILKLHKQGLTKIEIMKKTGLKKSTVSGYLPYTKNIYKADELSTDAERIQLFRLRQERCQNFNKDISSMTVEEEEKYLWETLVYLQGCIFHTSGRGDNPGVRFKYTIRGGEMFVNRKNKSITRATVNVAYHKAIEVQNAEGAVSGPKKLGTFGASYLYPIFLRLGICSSDSEMREEVLSAMGT